eukprot:TRINITY_DN76597_c0_g1_i1.p1 TRINITY_DN76597_c0_g1~~TRINITY_DN76597_c0_g1_i1.p1  ORF type:complete len:206 (-),score=48.87 TRINITY_DN76597_c0_g1_i1:302-919(-)
MTRQLRETLVCNLEMLSGEHVLVEAQTSWKIQELRQHIMCELNIPEYEQGFAQAGVPLHNDVALADLRSKDTDAPLQLSFIRSIKPTYISELTAEEMWEAFLQRSRDNGLTVDGMSASRVLHMARMPQDARSLQRQVHVPDSFTFPELLWHVSALREALLRRVTSKEWIFDVGRTTCPRVQHGTESDENENVQGRMADEDEDFDD